jgi:Helix-hairpin-helix containing domain/AAA domain
VIELVDRLAQGGAPAHLASAVTAALGANAADDLAADPWRLLDVPGVRPDQADAYARTLLRGTATLTDPRRSTALACWLLRRAASDGHTAMPTKTLLAALATYDAAPSDPAVLRTDGRIVLCGDGLAALQTYASLEDALADRLALLAESTPEPVAGLPDNGLTTVVGTTLSARRAYVTDLAAVAERCGQRVGRASGAAIRQRIGVLGSADVAIVEDAELLSAPDAAALVDQLSAGQRLVLVGDPALLPPTGPGQVFTDLISHAASVVLPDQSERALDRLVLDVRAGVLPRVEDPERSVVVVPADDSSAVRRTVQLVTDSIPRVFNLSADDVLVVTPRRSGVAGATALDMALAKELGDAGAKPRAVTVHEAQGRRPGAVVVVLPAESAGSLSRPLVAAAFGMADRHLSVVHACGPALAEAVRRVSSRPRVTRLAGLLSQQAPAHVGAT